MPALKPLPTSCALGEVGGEELLLGAAPEEMTEEEAAEKDSEAFDADKKEDGPPKETQDTIDRIEQASNLFKSKKKENEYKAIVEKHMKQGGFASFEEMPKVALDTTLSDLREKYAEIGKEE